MNVEKIDFTDDLYEIYCLQKNRKIFGENYKKKPIVILGCSYVYGHGLKREQSFSYILSEITQRPVYNFSECGSEVIRSLEKLNSFIDKSPKNREIISNAEYYIYVYMFDHIDRYLFENNYLYTYYENFFPPKNKITKLLIKVPLFKLLMVLYQENNIFKDMKKDYSFANINASIDKSSLLLKNIMLYAYKQIKEVSPNAKFIIINYNSNFDKQHFHMLKIYFDKGVQKSHIWQEPAGNNDIIFVNTRDLTGFSFNKDYFLEKDITPVHPNGKSWELFTPLFAKKYIN